MAFDYRTATVHEITAHAAMLRGKTVGAILDFDKSESASKTKGLVGHAVEAFFGIPPNSRSGPDFPAAGVELKVVPLKRSGSRLMAKERTVVSMIDYDQMVLESWDAASVRRKLHMLLVFYEHLVDAPKSAFPFTDVILWHPDDETLHLMKADWERCRSKIRLGLAHELSESDGRVMGPCTKGPHSREMRRQPFGAIPAKPRAFALKPSFTTEILRTARSGRAADWHDLRIRDSDRFEEVLLERFRPFQGLSVDQAAEKLKMPRSRSKAYAAAVARRIFGGRGFKEEIGEFRVMGLTPRVTRVDRTLMPYESTSFPAVRYSELLAESWVDSDLLARVEYMLFIPVMGLTKSTPQGDCTFELPRFWRPTADDLRLIQQEWELFRLEIERGLANELTPASMTSAIHVRPHARNAMDTDVAPGIGPTIKKSFWLNKPFVAQILRGER